MKNILLFSVLCLLFSNKINAQEIKVVKLKEVLAEMQKNKSLEQKDTTLVLNFWATWCVPCVKELPDFIKLANENDQFSKKIILIAVEDELKKVKAFLTKKDFLIKNKNQIEFWLLDEKDANTWVSAIEQHWDGAIPFTMFWKNAQKTTHLGEITYQELQNLLKL